MGETKLSAASSSEEQTWSSEQVYEAMARLNCVGNLREAQERVAELGGKDGRWTTSKAFMLMSGAGFPGTIEEARTHLANKKPRQ
jgi:hypothetical protein